MTKISALSSLTGAGVDQANDVLVIVDTSAGTDKKITVAELLGLVTDITGLLDFKGATDCSANPNYPAASKGDFYLVSVAGKIGGASGISVEVGDSYFATADNAGGTQAGVGTSWTVIQGNITSYLPLSGGTLTGDLVVPDEAYDATNWDGNLEVPTKNAVRDKIEAISAGGVSSIDDLNDVDTTSTPPSNGDVLTWNNGASQWKPSAPTGGSTVTAWKDPVRVATVSAGTLASSFENGDTVDGVTLATGDRILIKDQATGSENGIYTVNASGAPTRSTDADAGSELVGATVFVSEGTVNKDSTFVCTNDATPTLGTTALTFGRRTGDWVLFTNSPSGVANSDFTNLGAFRDFLVVCRNVTQSVSGVLALRVSTNNGSSYNAASGDYVLVPASGAEANDTFMGAFHGTSATAARSGSMFLPAAGVNGGVKTSDCISAGAGANRFFVASTSPINALRVLSSSGGNITGTIYLFAR